MGKNKKRTKRRSNKHKLLREFAKYMVAGGAFFWSGYATFFVADSILGWELWWAKQTANVVGLTVNFILERYWVFAGERKRSVLREAGWRYVVLTTINFVIDYLIIRGLKDILGITPYIGQFVSSGFFTGWNWFWYKYWVFRGRIPPKRVHPKRKSNTGKKRRRG